MKRLFLLFITFFTFSLQAKANEMPVNLKTFLKDRFPGIVFKIDNSFAVGSETFLPLVPDTTRPAEKIEITFLVPDKNIPKLFWFSNNWVFVKLLKKNEGSQTILDLKELPGEYKERFLKLKFPGDLVVPKGFALKDELSPLAGSLLIEKERNGVSAYGRIGVEQNKVVGDIGEKKIKGVLYLTSPDTGKVVYLNLSDLSVINQIQTQGTPWGITFDKTNNLFFVTDLAKSQIYKLKPLESSIQESLELPAMSNPADIKLSEDGSILYILEKSANDLAVYNTSETGLKLITKSKLPPSPTSFLYLKEAGIVAVVCPNTNNLVFLNANDFQPIFRIKIEGGPEKIISDLTGNILYVANRNGNSVSEISVTEKKVKNTIQAGETPTSLVIHPGGKFLYVSNGKSNTINIIDLETKQITDTIPLPVETQFPGDIKLTPDGQWLIVTSETTNTISIIDLALKKVAVKLDVGATTHAAYVLEN